MSNELMKRENSSCSTLGTIENTQRMCAALMKSKYYAAMGEAGLFAIVQKAHALGIEPLDALNGGLYYVQGKVGMSSEMMASLIRQQGHSIIKDPKSDKSVCILSGRRIDNGDTWQISFSMEDAKRAGLARGMYEKYPEIMLYNRAMSTLARQLFPDVIKGAGYTHEELMEIKSASSTNAVQEAEQIELISEDQAESLQTVLSGCDVRYQRSVSEFLQKGGIDSISSLPTSMYARVMTAALKKREEVVQPIAENDEDSTVMDDEVLDYASASATG